MTVVVAGAIIFLLAYLFYRSIIIALLFTPASLFYPSFRDKRTEALRKEEISVQFKDMLYSLSSSMSAGRTFESALKDVRRDLRVLYPGNESSIMTEVDIMIRKLECNEPVESVVMDFADRMESEDIRNFAEVLKIGKRTGANLLEVIKNTTSIINDKLEIRHEIDTMLAERKFEQKILNIIPIAMILILSVSAPSYMEPVFTTTEGRIITTISIALLCIAWFLSKKITDIKL